MDLPDKTSRAILEYTREQLIYTALAALTVVVLLTSAALYGSRTITRTLLKIASAAQRLSGGDFSVRLNMHTGDERDQVIQAFNELGPKLEDQVRIRNSLLLAKEVQRSLLPFENPDNGDKNCGGIVHNQAHPHLGFAQKRSCDHTVISCNHRSQYVI